MNLYDEAIKAHKRGDDEQARLLYMNAEMNEIADGDEIGDGPYDRMTINELGDHVVATDSKSALFALLDRMTGR